MHPQRRHAIVVGGSMSGLFAAHYLRRRGWGVEIFERSPVPLTGRGAGIMTHPEIRQALEWLGLDTEHDFGVPIEGRLVLDPSSGAVIGRKHLPQIATSWNRLFEMLMGSFGSESYYLGREVLGVSQNAASATVHLGGTDPRNADLVVGADGFRSVVREQFAPMADPVYAGYVAWRGLVDEARVHDVLGPEVFERLAFCLPPGEQFLGYPVAGPGNDLRPGHRSWNVVWYRPAEQTREMPRLLTDETGKLHELSIPPPLVSRPVVAEMRAAAERLLAPQFSAAMRCVDNPFLQPIYDLESRHMAFGRVALVGDAAFVIRPHVGGGVVKAAQDAAALAAALESHETVADGLRAYGAQRIGIGRRFIAQARRLGCYLRREFPDEAERARAAFHAHPQQVMAETALLDFLR